MNAAQLTLDNLARYGEYSATWFEDRMCINAVALKPDARLTTDELIAHLEQYVTKFKLPSEIVWLDALPKGSTGKILKRALREQWQRKQ